MHTTMTDHIQVSIPSERQMYTAVADRDERFDGRFFYGVVTTGVYCRPSCASRRPRPENIRFFADPSSAARAGFRACKRCKPDRTHPAVESMVALARLIEARADETISLGTLAAHAGLSPSHLQKKFKSVFGITPRQYRDAVRLGRLKSALKSGSDVSGAIYDAGFGSPSRVYGEASRNIGMTPAVYRAGGEGETIHYASRDSALGPLMLAATSRGVCFVQFGPDVDALYEALHEEFPGATLVASTSQEGEQLQRWIDALDDYLAKDAPRPDLPLDLRGTAFQVKVWRFLLDVGEGEVISYGELAEGIGRRGSARAVASACGANRIGVLVPCHRVLCAHGDLGGYRWGVERKRALLDRERRERAAR